ncbi:MAG: hypothetical protein ACI9IP_003390 [Arcticibacterium sp.]|jgi:hypothetical protein
MKSILSVLCIAFLFSCQQAKEKEVEINEPVVELENPFIHHVYFYLNNPDSMEDRDELVKGLNELSMVSTIQKHYIGFPASTDREVIVKDYAVSWMCMFKNFEEEEMYQIDPIHLKFIEDYSHLWSGVKVYDSIH